MNLNPPLISVLMPTFNSGAYLQDAIASVLNQTHTNLQLLILDDGSKDDTLTLAGKFEDSRIEVFSSTENMGQSLQLNKGIQLSKGEYISIMHSDDIMFPGKLAQQLDYLQRNPLIGVCGCNVQLIGDRTDTWLYPEDDQACKDSLLVSVPFAHPAVMMRRSILSGMETVYTPGLAAAEDYDLWVKLANKTNFGNVQQVLLQYRIHDTQLSVVKKQEEEQIVDIIRKKMIAGMLEISQQRDAENCFRTIYYPNDVNLPDYLYALKQLWNANREKHFFSTTVLAARLKHSLFKKLSGLSSVQKIKYCFQYPVLFEIAGIKTMIRIFGKIGTGAVV